MKSVYRAKVDEDDQVIKSFMRKVVSHAPTDCRSLANIRHLSRKLTRIMTQENMLDEAEDQPTDKKEKK